MPPFVERHTLKGKEGTPFAGRKFGSVFGLPLGITADMIERDKTYFVAHNPRENHTYGKRYASEAEAIASFNAFADSRCNDFRAELEQMTDERLQSQADYWLNL